MPEPLVALADVAPVWTSDIVVAVVAVVLLGVLALVLVIRWVMRRGRDK